MATFQRATPFPKVKAKRAHMTKWYALTIGLIMLVIIQALYTGFLSGNTHSDSPNADYSALQAQFDTLKRQYDSLNTEYLSLQSQYETLNSSSFSRESEYLSLQSRYNELNSEYTSLNLQYISLQSTYNALNSSYSSLNSHYISLQSSYNALNATCTSLNSQYLALQSSYNSLNYSYTSLNSQYLALQSSYNSLRTQYDALLASYNATPTEYDQLRYQIDQRVQHYDIYEFITANDPSVQQITTQITGGWSNTSDWNEYWTDTKALYDWVVANITYNYDGFYPILPLSLPGNVTFITEMWQFPNETLNVKRGDCEDMAILLCSMIRYYVEDNYWAECIWIAGSNGAHVAVQIPVSEDKLAIVDPAGNYYTSDGLGHLVSKDITTEIGTWLDYWKPQLGSDARVYRVFADYMDQTFISTSDYTVWMYSR